MQLRLCEKKLRKNVYTEIKFQKKEEKILNFEIFCLSNKNYEFVIKLQIKKKFLKVEI